MTQAEKFLGRDPAVCHDADESRHEEGDNALDCEERADVGAHSDASEVHSERTEISSPRCEDQEVHHNESESDVAG